MKYYHYFGTESEYNQARNNNYKEPWLSYTVGKGINYNKSEEEKPLTFEILSSGYIKWSKFNDSEKPMSDLTIYYSKNGGERVSITATSGSPVQIDVVEGDRVEFFGNNNRYTGNSAWSTYGFYGTTCQFNLSGNLMSMISSENFASVKTFNQNSDYNFAYLFSQCSTLISAEKLFLGADTLTSYCYYFLFNRCTSLTTAPKLPATTLATNCYYDMFYGCTSLTTAPELPATTLAYNCYSYMFQGCTGLTSIPELPATILAQSCYNGMFLGCTGLTEVPELPATTLEILCYANMFNSCTGLTKVHSLPAQTLVERCYLQMFKGCTNLNYIKCLATSLSADRPLLDWVSGIAATGTFVRASGVESWTTGVSGIPSGWTVQTASS